MSISGPVSVEIHDMPPAKLLVAGFSSSGMFSVLRRLADVLAEVEIRAHVASVPRSKLLRLR